MLDLRPSCEHCDTDLPRESAVARICSFECTFCASCVDTVLSNVCPNCGGGFEKRPIRPATDHVGPTWAIDRPQRTASTNPSMPRSTLIWLKSCPVLRQKTASSRLPIHTKRIIIQE